MSISMNRPENAADPPMERAMTVVATRAIAGCFALAAFSIALMAGLAVGNTATSILTRALFAMVACYPLGLLVGFVCGHVINQHVANKAGSRSETDTAVAPAEQSAESAEPEEDVIVV